MPVKCDNLTRENVWTQTPTCREHRKRLYEVGVHINRSMYCWTGHADTCCQLPCYSALCHIVSTRQRFLVIFLTAFWFCPFSTGQPNSSTVGGRFDNFDNPKWKLKTPSTTDSFLSLVGQLKQKISESCQIYVRKL